MDFTVQKISNDEFLRSLRQKGLIIRVDGESNLEIDAPAGILEESLVEEIRLRKQDLLDYFRNITAGAVEEGIPCAPELPCYDLSSSQMNVWAINELWNEYAVYYNIDSVNVWQGTFDPARFEQAIRIAGFEGPGWCPVDPFLDRSDLYLIAHIVAPPRRQAGVVIVDEARGRTRV